MKLNIRKAIGNAMRQFLSQLLSFELVDPSLPFETLFSDSEVSDSWGTGRTLILFPLPLFECWCHLFHNVTAYPNKADVTKMVQANVHMDAGWILMIVPNRFIETNRSVISIAILPGTTRDSPDNYLIKTSNKWLMPFLWVMWDMDSPSTVLYN